MKTITLDKNEIRALTLLLNTIPCESGCAYDELQNNDKINCSNCPFIKDMQSIRNKLEI
jgi:hypothetical protein